MSLPSASLAMTSTRGIGVTDSIKLAAAVSSVEDINDFVDAFCSARGIADAMKFELQLVLEELLVNVCMHGQPSDGSVAQVDVCMGLEGDCLTLRFSDNGLAFNPLEQAAPDTDKSLEDIQIGGLGIVLLRQLMDDIRYDHHDGFNHLSMKKVLSATDLAPSITERASQQ